MIMEITREEYIKALDIVEAYHRQIKISVKKIEIGATVVFSKSFSKYVTIGKEYVITCVSLYDTHFGITDDQGKAKDIGIGTNRYHYKIL